MFGFLKVVLVAAIFERMSQIKLVVVIVLYPTSSEGWGGGMNSAKIQ